MSSRASFNIETGGQKGHVMWILTNQQGAWWCNALQLPSEYIDAMESIYRYTFLGVWGSEEHQSGHCREHRFLTGAAQENKPRTTAHHVYTQTPTMREGSTRSWPHQISRFRQRGSQQPSRVRGSQHCYVLLYIGIHGNHKFHHTTQNSCFQSSQF